MRLVGFDLETTSTDVKTTTPCQICLILREGSEDQVLVNTLTKPEGLIEPGATQVTGITNQMVANAPDYREAAQITKQWVDYTKAEYVVGYNILQFDLPIINRCAGAEVFAGCKPIDLLNAAMRYFPTIESSFKLGLMYHRFVGKPLEGAHDASVDVIGCLDLLFAMLPYVQMSIEDMAADLAVPKPYEVMPIGKHKGLKLKDVPKSWAKWMATNASDMRPDLKATVDFILAH